MMLHAMHKRFAHEPQLRAPLEQIDLVLDLQQPSLAHIQILGSLLTDTELFDDARALYQELANHFPEAPQGLVSMAHLAMRRMAWEEALTHWDEVVRRFRGKLNASWQGDRATTLMELRRFEEAECIFRDLTRDFGPTPVGFVGLARLSMLRGLWPEALLFWDHVVSNFSDHVNPHWHAGRANALSHLGRRDEAENIYQRLANDLPARPSGFVGLAEIAMQRRAWPEALARWDDVMKRFSTMLSPHWQIARAHVLVELGRSENAEAVFRRIIQSNPESTSASLGLLKMLMAKGQIKEARSTLDSSPFRSAPVPGLIQRKFDILIKLGCHDEARSEFKRILTTATEPAILNSLFAFVPRLHSGWRRTEIWLALLQKVEMALSCSDCKWMPSAVVLKARLFLALRDYDRFLALIDDTTRRENLGEHQYRLLAVAARLRETSFPDYSALKIFGIGLPKTGTTSLASALSTMGFNTLDWSNPLTCELMCDADLHLFDAFTDSPACMNFEKYYYMFPSSRFIYTTRPLDSWRTSQTRHFERHLQYSKFEDLKQAMSQRDRFHFGADFTNINMGLYFNHKDFDEAYRTYDRRVRQFFQDKPSSRFLELDITHGQWGPICTFLDRSLPAVPFPWLNQKPSVQSD